MLEDTEDLAEELKRLHEAASAFGRTLTDLKQSVAKVAGVIVQIAKDAKLEIPTDPNPELLGSHLEVFPPFYISYDSGTATRPGGYELFIHRGSRDDVEQDFTGNLLDPEDMSWDDALDFAYCISEHWLSDYSDQLALMSKKNVAALESVERDAARILDIVKARMETSGDQSPPRTTDQNPL